jgi:hypothetical protein
MGGATVTGSGRRNSHFQLPGYDLRLEVHDPLSCLFTMMVANLNLRFLSLRRLLCVCSSSDRWHVSFVRVRVPPGKTQADVDQWCDDFKNELEKAKNDGMEAIPSQEKMFRALALFVLLGEYEQSISM